MCEYERRYEKMSKLSMTLIGVILVCLTGCDNDKHSARVLERTTSSAERRQIRAEERMENERRENERRENERRENERRENERRENERREKEKAALKEEGRLKKRREQALKIISHEVAADKELVRQYQNEVFAIEENKSAFLRRLNGIEAPDSEIVTNTVTIHAGVEKTKTVVTKVELSENQKSIWKLRTMFADDATCSMYDANTDRSAKKILHELDKEWNTAQDDYLNVTKELQKIDAEEARERQSLKTEFQSERNARISKGSRRIAALKKQREEVLKKIQDHESGRCLMRQMKGPRVTHGIYHGEGGACKCRTEQWRNTLWSINNEINYIQSKTTAEQSTAVGLEESAKLDAISSEASRKRAEINQEYTHQSAVLKGIIDKYEKLLVQDLLDCMVARRENLLQQIDEIVARNELKIKYIDGRSELSPDMATTFINADNQKTVVGLHLLDAKSELQERENRRLINTIKALNDTPINITETSGEKSERKATRKKR